MNSSDLPGNSPEALQSLPMIMTADYILYAVVVAAITVVAYCWPEKYPSAKLLLVNRKATYDLFNFGSRKNYILNAPRILAEGIQKVSIFSIPNFEVRRLLICDHAGRQDQFVSSND